MAENIVSNLFGIDPTALQAQQQATDYAQAFKYAQLNPAEQAQFGGFLGGQQLGRAVPAMFGIEDPILAKANTARRLASQFDITTDQGLRDYAAALAQNGAPDLAQLAIKRADEIRTTGLKQAELQTQAIRNITTATAEKIKQVGLTPDGRQVYQAGDEQYVLAEGGQRVPYYGSLQGKTAKTEINLGSLGDLFARKFTEAETKNIADSIAKAQDALQTGSKVSRDIAEIEKILPNTFTGQFANFSKTASKTLSAIGIPISDKASNTEVLQALTNNLVLPAVKQLPGSLAAKELAFLQQTKPEALQEPATIKRLLNMIKEDIGVNRVLVKRADEYRKADKLGSLQGFNIALQQDSIYQDLRRYNALKATIASGGKITQAQADFAKKFEQEIGME